MGKQLQILPLAELMKASCKNLYHPLKIGNLQLDGNLFLAPVAGYSDCAFRYVCIEGGANFTYTEMVSSEALVRNSAKTVKLLVRAENEKQYAVQIFGGNPESMAQAAELVLQKAHPELIDINAGCPVPKIVKSGAGSALTKDFEKLYLVTKAVVDAVNGKVPVMVKIRSGWDNSSLSWKEAAEAAVSAGAAAITLHPRTRAQGYEGKADWTLLAKLTDFIGGRIPVFASGDIFSPDAAKNVIEQTNVDGVMFARGAMGNPFIFAETKHYLQTGELKTVTPQTRIKAGMRELQILTGEKGELSACREMRKRFCAYSKGLENSSQLRTRIVAANTVTDFEGLFAPYIQD